MREPYTQLFLHLVWATWDRLPSLTSDLRESVYACIKAECKKLNVQVIALGGMADHLHVLVRIPTTVSVATLVKQLKGSTSHFVNHCTECKDTFRWQEGYGAFTVSKSVGPTIRSYVLNQEEHHRENTTSKDMEYCWIDQNGKPNA